MSNKKRVIKSQRKNSMPQTLKESPLVKQARRFFSEPEPSTVHVRDWYPAYPGEPQIVQSCTTYSVGEVPALISMQK